VFIRIAKVFVCLAALSFSTDVFAARVTQSKKGKVIIDLEGQEAAVNQNIILVNAQNKRVAIAKITLVKNGKAIATITKGKAQGNEKVTLVGKAKASGGDGPITQPQETPIYTASSKKISVIATMMSNSMTTRQIDGSANTEDVAMKGSTFGVTAAVDWPVMPSLSLRGTLGYEPFKASGDSKYLACDGQSSITCTADITYLSGGGYVRWDVTRPKTQF
jgi:hypothetical protein